MAIKRRISATANMPVKCVGSIQQFTLQIVLKCC